MPADLIRSRPVGARGLRIVVALGMLCALGLPIGMASASAGTVPMVSSGRSDSMAALSAVERIAVAPPQPRVDDRDHQVSTGTAAPPSSTVGRSGTIDARLRSETSRRARAAGVRLRAPPRV